jgi:hypothetical protein
MAKKRIVMVHGRAQEGKSSAELAKEWLPGLVEGTGGAFNPDKHEVVFPFYGDVLGGYVTAMKAGPQDILNRGPADATPLTAAEQLQIEILRDLIGDAAEKGLIREADVKALAPDPQVMDRGVTDWGITHLLAKVASLIPGAQDAAFALALRDVSIYLTVAQAKRDVDTIVAHAIQTPCVVVAHSLGCVVAYDVLRKRAGEASNVPLLVTLGSPLGVPAIRDTLKPTTWPKGLGSWFNARDSRDIVATYGMDPSVFVPGSGTIDNAAPVFNNGADSHSIAGYLAVPLVANRITAGVAALP